MKKHKMESINTIINSLLRGEGVSLSEIELNNSETGNEIWRISRNNLVIAIVIKEVDTNIINEKFINTLKAGDIVILERDTFNKLKMIGSVREVILEK